MYATTRYNFVRLKATHKISPLEELVGGDLPLAVPSGQQVCVLHQITYHEQCLLVFQQCNHQNLCHRHHYIQYSDTIHLCYNV